jgi:hypothetical protein
MSARQKKSSQSHDGDIDKVRSVGNWPPITGLFGLAALSFLPVLIKGNSQVLSSIDGDTWSQFFYWRRFSYGSLAHGDLPLWNPYNFSGMPFVAAMQSAIFYPPNLIFFIFDTPFAINLSIALHCFCASVFTYLFARYIGIEALGAALSAVTFAYSAPYFVHIYPGHLPHLAAMWMPLMFLAMEAFLRHRKIRYAIWAGVCLSLEILAGYPQYPFYSALAVSWYFFMHLVLRKERGDLLHFLSGYALFITCAVLLPAVQLVPAWELVRNSARGAVSYAWISTFSLPPENLLTLFLPNLFGDMVNVPYWGKNNLWEMSIYLGIVPLAMIGVGLALNRSRNVIVFTAIGGFFLLLALGKHTPFLWVLYTCIPGFNLFRGVAKAAFVFAFASSLIAGFGLDTVHGLIVKSDRRLRKLVFSFLLTALLFAVIGGIIAIAGEGAWRGLIRAYSATEEHFESLPLDQGFFTASWTMLWSDVAKLVIITLSLGALCWIAWKRWSHSGQIIILSILALAVVDLWHFSSRYLVSFKPQILFMDPELKAFFESDTEPFRIATPLARLRNHLLNIGMIEGIENVGGYDAIVVKSYSEFIDFTQGLPIDEPNLLMGINRISPLLNLLNVKYYLVPSSVTLNVLGFDLAFQNNGNKVYRSLKVLPRSFVVHNFRVETGAEGTFRQMAEPGFDPTLTAILAESVDELPRNTPYHSPVPRVLEHSPKRVVIEAEAVAPGLLVSADTYYPGWKAFVDGSETRIYRANHVMRAVVLPQGRHTIEFRYEPVSFKIGVALSAGTVLLLVGIFALPRWRHRAL